MSLNLVICCSRRGHTEFVTRQIAARCHADLARRCDHLVLARPALTERAVLQCQRDPALHRFLLALKRVRTVCVSLPPIQNQAPA